MADEEQVQEVTEETPEVEEETTETVTEEANASEATEDTSEEAESTDAAEKHRKAFEDQKRRAEKAEQELKALKAKQGKGTEKEPDPVYSALEQRVVRAELSAAGVKHPDDQQYVIDAAKRLGVEPGEAVNDEIIAAKLERMQASRKTKDATPSPQRRGTPSGTNDVARLADKVAAGAALPTDPALAEKVQAEIARRSQAAA